LLDFLRHTPKNFTLSEADRARQPEVPENLWVKCTRCKELSYVKEFENSLKVCQKCGYHARLSAAERETIVLRVVLDLDTETAARLLGISPTACSTRLSRALQRLEEELIDGRD